MIYINLEGHNLEFEINEIVALFFQDETCFIDEIPAECRDIFIQSKLLETGNTIKLKTKVHFNGVETEMCLERDVPLKPEYIRKKHKKRYIKLSLLRHLSQVTGKAMPWGIMTGIRPTKVIQELFANGFSDDEIINKLINDFGMSDQKSEILMEVARTEKNILEQNNPNKVSLYLNVPFCPDRCLYCSFTSNPIKKYSKVVDTYLTCLTKEIEAAEEIIRKKNWDIETIYVGGGTPTSLNNDQLIILLQKLYEILNLNNLKEFTIEAGRPDTIDEMKLSTLKRFGVNRISINPQTMNQKTLDIIGRKHTIDDVVSAFSSARKIGFNNINMDIIIGLPGEDSEMMKNTLDFIEKLSPDSITVHTLAIKRGSILIDRQNEYGVPDKNEVENMMDMCRKKTVEMKMRPYYLYRQRKMVGHEENIGYCTSGKECIYNIKMIEEVQNIIALGPGAVSRVIDYETGEVIKVFNDKSVEGYISRIDEMIEKKKKAFSIVV